MMKNLYLDRSVLLAVFYIINISALSLHPASAGPMAFSASIGSQESKVSSTKNSKEISVYYNGAVWSEDSQNVYFSKFTKIEPSEEEINQIRENALKIMVEEFEKIKPEDRGNEAVRKQVMDRLPKIEDLTKPTYQKLDIFRYNLPTKKLDFIAGMDLQPCGYPLLISFDGMTLNNTLKWAVGDQAGECVNTVYSLNLGTSKIDKLGDIEDLYKIQIFENKSMLGSWIFEKTYPNAQRFLSPNRQAYIQITGSPAFGYGSRDSSGPKNNLIGIFFDPSVRLSTLEDLGWLGGHVDESMMRILNQYSPQHFIDQEKIISPEEQAARKNISIE